MDVFSAYNLGTSGWLSIQAASLIFSPPLVAAILSSEFNQLTPLEQYFARSLGFALLALAILSLILSGLIPLNSAAADDPVAASTRAYAAPTVLSTMFYHSFVAIYNYIRFTRSQQPGFVLAAIGSGILAAIGLWTLLFGNTSGHISRRTGADKRTSGWPFQNSEADKKRASKKVL